MTPCSNYQYHTSQYTSMRLDMSTRNNSLQSFILNNKFTHVWRVNDQEQRFVPSPIHSCHHSPITSYVVQPTKRNADCTFPVEQVPEQLAQIRVIWLIIKAQTPAVLEVCCEVHWKASAQYFDGGGHLLLANLLVLVPLGGSFQALSYRRRHQLPKYAYLLDSCIKKNVYTCKQQMTLQKAYLTCQGRLPRRKYIST